VDEGDVGDKIDLVLTEQKPPQKSQWRQHPVVEEVATHHR
jgi:hypothetical protein